MQFGLADVVGSALQLAEDHRHQLADIARAGGRMNAEHAGVGEAPVEGIDRIAEPAALAHLLEEARRHSAAEHGGQNLRGIEAFRGIGAALEADDDLRLHRFARLAHVAASVDGRHRRRTGVAAKRSEAFVRQLHDLLMVHRAGRRQHHLRSAIMAGEIGIQHGRTGGAHRLWRAEDRASDRLGRIGGLGEQVVDAVVRRIQRRPDLLHDDVLFARQFLRIEGRVLQDIGQDIEGQRHVVLEDAGVIGGRLDAGGGVHLAADSLDLLGDFQRRAFARALEGHVLEQMGEAVLLLLFRARTGADPDAKGGALQFVHRMRDDRKAGLKTRQANGHDVRLSSGMARLWAAM